MFLACLDCLYVNRLYRYHIPIKKFLNVLYVFKIISFSDFSTTTNNETPVEEAVKTVLAEEATTIRNDLMTTIRTDVMTTTPKPNLETIQTERIQTLQKEVLSDERLLSEIRQFTNAQRQGK
jgi:hypothetical protein